MAPGKSLSDIRLAQDLTNSTESFTSAKRSSSLSCLSTDVSDDDTEQKQKEKRKSKKKRFKLFRKSHSEFRDAENSIVQHNVSPTLTQRLTSVFRKKRKAKHYKISHSPADDGNDADLNQDNPAVDQDNLSGNNEIHQHEDDVVETTQRDDHNASSRRHSKTTGIYSDRSIEEGLRNSKSPSVIIHVKSNSKEDDNVWTHSHVEGYGHIRKPKCQLDDKEEEMFRRELELSRREDEISRREAETSRREAEISRREDEMSRRETDILSSQQDTIETLNQVIRVIGDIVRNPRYIKMSGCQNIQIGTGSDEVQHNLDQVCSILDGLCEKYEDIKKTTETTLDSVKDLQNESTGHREQLHKLADFLETKLRHHKEAEEPQHISKTAHSTQEQMEINRCNIACSKPSSNVWGPSTVPDFVVSSHVSLDKTMKQVLSEVQFIKDNLLSPSKLPSVTCQ